MECFVVHLLNNFTFFVLHKNSPFVLRKSAKACAIFVIQRCSSAIKRVFRNEKIFLTLSLLGTELEVTRARFATVAHESVGP